MIIFDDNSNQPVWHDKFPSSFLLEDVLEIVNLKGKNWLKGRGAKDLWEGSQGPMDLMDFA